MGADSAAFFKGFYTDPVQTVAFTVIFVFLTVLITSVGVSKGIEKFSAIAMPALLCNALHSYRKKCDASRCI